MRINPAAAASLRGRIIPRPLPPPSNQLAGALAVLPATIVTISPEAKQLAKQHQKVQPPSASAKADMQTSRDPRPN